MNAELKKEKKWSDANRLSLNIAKLILSFFIVNPKIHILFTPLQVYVPHKSMVPQNIHGY